jgi:hypothetical protein
MPAAPHVLDLQLTLRDVDRPVLRTLRVSSGATLPRAQRLICVCFGWNGGRAYAFEAAHLRYAAGGGRGGALGGGDVRLRQLLPDAGAELEFEYGDSAPWFVHARVGKIFAPSDAIATPRCLGAEGIAPPLDAGGAEVWNEREHDATVDLIPELALARDGSSTRIPIRLDAINAELTRLR